MAEAIEGETVIHERNTQTRIALLECQWEQKCRTYTETRYCVAKNNDRTVATLSKRYRLVEFKEMLTKIDGK